MRDAARNAGRFAVWWIVLFAIWWALVGEFSVDELVAGVGAAILGAAAGVLITAHRMVDGRTLARTLKVVPSVLRAVAVDFAVIIAVLARRIAAGDRGTAGSFIRRRVALDPGRLRDPGVRSWLTIAATVSPNAYVLDLDPERGEVLIHDLRPLRSSEEPA